jgi:cyclopropane-fatty-acyl-phospholipid synthase
MSNVDAANSSGRIPLGYLDRLAHRFVTAHLGGLRRGEITLHDPSGSSALGQAADLHATLQVHRLQFFRQAVLGGTLSVAESYVRGDWDCDDLTSLFRIFVRNRGFADRLDRGLVGLARYGHRLIHWWHANTRTGSRRNIEAHYDLGNDFFRLWLDDTMAYSSGIFPGPGASLQEASVAKCDRICRKLDLRPSDDVLEIGTGWGGFATHAAKTYGCQVTTTTISREQFEVARQKIQNAGLTNQVTLLQQDYRELNGQFDKLASIEMIEAVGYRNFDRFFRQCGKLLRPDGSLVLQAIVMPDRGYKRYLKSVDFIQRYVFPGGCLPSLGAILASVGRVTDMRFVQAEDFAPHYAETLRRWRQTFRLRLDDVQRLGYSDEFIRLWNYYLCYCEAAFEERAIGVLQIQFDKPECRRDTVDLGRAFDGERNCPATFEPLSRRPRERSRCGK